MQETGFQKEIRLLSSQDSYRKQQEQATIARIKAQAAAVRNAAGVTGPGGGTSSGTVFPDGKGGYRVEGAKFTPQAGYNQQGFKVQPGVAQPAPAPKAAPANKTIPSKRVILPD
jgi:hypothetical protein